MDNKVCKPLIKSLIALAVSSTLFSASAISQTLEQAVAQALDTNPDIRQAFNRFKAQEEQVNQAFSGYLPTVDLTAGYGWEKTDSPVTRSSGGDVELDRGEAGISIRQILFNGFLTSSEIGRTKRETSAEQWTLFGTAEDMALQVAKVYLGYLKAEQLVVLSEINLKSHEEIYNQIKQKTESGLGSTADFTQVTGRLARAKSNLVAANNNLMDARSQFVRVVNARPEEMIIPIPDADILPTSLEKALEIAKEHHPFIKASMNDIEAAQYQRESAKSNYLPEVSLELQGNWNNDLDGTRGHNDDLLAMVRIRYNLFSGGRDVSRDREAAYKINLAHEANQRTYRDVVEGITLAWNARESLSEQLGYIRDHVKAAKDTQEAYAQQFRLGQRTLLDLLDAENELFEARKSYITSEFDELIAQYRILNATGHLLDSLRITTPESWLSEDNYEGGVSQ